MISLVQMLSGDIDLACRSIASVPFVDDVLISKEAQQRLFFGGRFDLPTDWREKLMVAAGRVARVMEWDIHEVDPLVSFASVETPIRNALSHLVPPGNLILHLDSDEVVLNPEESSRWVRSIKWHTSYCFCASTEVVFKVIGATALIASSATAWPTPIITSQAGRYVNGRNTGENRVASPLRILHWSYGRSRDEVIRKLTWSAPYMGGRERTQELLDLWDSVTLETYGSFVDFWPHGDGRAWHRLRAVPLADALAGRI